MKDGIYGILLTNGKVTGVCSQKNKLYGIGQRPVKIHYTKDTKEFPPCNFVSPLSPFVVWI